MTLYVIVLKDLHNAGVDAMLSNDGWAAVEAPGFKRSDGWAFNVWKRYFATGNTYLIKTKELMIGGVISSKVSSQGCEAGASTSRVCDSISCAGVPIEHTSFLDMSVPF